MFWSDEGKETDSMETIKLVRAEMHNLRLFYALTISLESCQADFTETSRNHSAFVFLHCVDKSIEYLVIAIVLCVR